jgi:hypothetical protein
MLAGKNRGRSVPHCIHCVLPTPGCEIRNAGRFINGIDRAEKTLRLTVTFFRGRGVRQAGTIGGKESSA